MSQEVEDFNHFRDKQLHAIDYTTGIITVKRRKAMYYDVGSKNSDGYVRLWCKKHLRMKHRLVYFLAHNVLPGPGEEIDHIDNIRHHNWISNLQILSKTKNNTACTDRTIGRFSEETIHGVCRMLQDTSVSDEEIAGYLCVSRATVRDIKTRRTRKKIGNNYFWPERGY